MKFPVCFAALMALILLPSTQGLAAEPARFGADQFEKIEAVPKWINSPKHRADKYGHEIDDDAMRFWCESPDEFMRWRVWLTKGVSGRTYPAVRVTYKADGPGPRAKQCRGELQPDAVAAVSYQHYTPYRRKTDRTWIVSSIQYRYVLSKNYLFEEAWSDRPLMADRSLGEDGAILTKDEFMLDARMMRDSRVNVAFSPTHTLKLRRSILGCQYLKETPLEGFHTAGLFYAAKPNRLDMRAELLAAMFDSGSALMTPGGCPVSSWQGARMTPEQWKNETDELERRLGKPLLVCPDMAVAPPKARYIYQREFYDTGGLSVESREEIKASVRKYLDVCDGITTNYLLGGLKRYHDQSFAAEFYRDGLIPLLLEVMSEPAYSEKYLGLSARLGYYNIKTNSRLDEDNTKTLRAGFEAAMAARPDFIYMPEWNEANENNYVQPTVHNSFAVMRLLRHYDDRMRGVEPSPRPGDDVSVPNLCVGYRKNLLWGERLEIELLNIPDSDSDETIRARLTLANPAGEVFRKYDWVTFTVGRLSDRTFAIPTEDIPLDRFSVLRPSIEVVGPDGTKREFKDGLHYILIRPTWNGNAKYVRQPLRDLAPVRDVRFDVTPADDGQRRIRLDLACDEPIKSVEVLENGREVAACDPTDEFPPRATHERFRVGFISGHRFPLKGTVTIRDTDFVARSVWHYRRNSNGVYRDGDDTIRFNVANAQLKYRVGFYLAVPRENLDHATLDFDFPNVKTTIPLSRVLKDGAALEVYEKGATLMVEPFHRLPLVPYPLREKTASLDVTQPSIASASDVSAYHVRVVTQSGKTWRSAPVVFDREPTGRRVALNVYSWSKETVAPRAVDASRIPVARYRLAGDPGNLAPTDEGRDWWGMLGYMENDSPFKYFRFYPKGETDTTPEPAAEDGRDCLKFNGRGNTVYFPRRTLPVGEFALSFEIKPTADKKQTLLFCREGDPGSLHVWMEKGGRLAGRYHARIKSNETDLLWFKQIDLAPEISVPIGEWSTVDIRYDLKNFHFSVNGVEGAPCPCDRQGFTAQPTVFGGFGPDDEWFEGYLSSFRVRHASSGAEHSQ